MDLEMSDTIKFSKFMSWKLYTYIMIRISRAKTNILNVNELNIF